MSEQKKGTGWILAQILLFLFYLILPSWNIPIPKWIQFCALIFIGFGVFLVTDSLLRLGRFLTPFPKPKPNSPLVQTGSYGMVRHPIYTGILFILLGFALFQSDLTRLVMAVVFLAFFDRKAHFEEKWLLETHPFYLDYQKKVKKIIPFLY